MYSLLILVIYLAFISLGLPDSLLGAAWPVMHTEIGVSISSMGIISMLISAGTVISSLLSDKITKKLGTSVVTVLSVFLTAVALLGFSFAQNIFIIVLLCIPYGLGAGAIDAALNNYVAVNYSSRHMSWLHCFWGVGTIISPFIMSYSLTNLTWNDGYRIVAFVQMGIGVILLLTWPLWKANKNNTAEVKETTDTKALGIVSALRIKGVPSLLLGFCGYCAAEGTAMAWSCTYLVEAKHMDEPTAAAFASMFFIGLTIGRFIGGFFMDRLGDKKMIWIGTIVLFAGITLMLIPGDVVYFALAGLIIMGLGCAPIYPCIIHSTPSNFGAENSGAIIGIQMASAYAGATFVPPLFGLIANILGFEILPIYIFMFAVMMIIMVDKTFRITEK